MLRAVMHLIHRELLMALRQRSDILNPLWFFLIVITLFPLGIGPEPKLLSRIAPGIIWVAALLAAMLSLERLFRDDFADGALEQMMLMPHPLGLLALAKVVAHWLLTGLPLLLISPLLAILLSLDMNTYLGRRRDAGTWHSGIEPARRGRGRVDGGIAQRRGIAQSADPAALYSGIDFCHLSHRCRGDELALWRAACHSGRHAGGGFDTDTAGCVGGVAGQPKLMAVS